MHHMRPITKECQSRYLVNKKSMVKVPPKGKIIGVDDALPHVLWTKYFLESQGYDLGLSILYQDNKSMLLLETNGLCSALKHTKHISPLFLY